MKAKYHRVLHLPLKKEWYKMIRSGQKTEEYREISLYWIKRITLHSNWRNASLLSDAKVLSSLFDNHLITVEFKPFYYAKLSYGYTKKYILKEIQYITIGYGKEEWGAKPDKLYFVIKFKKRPSVEITEQPLTIITQFFEFLEKENIKETWERAFSHAQPGISPIDYLNLQSFDPIRFIDSPFDWMRSGKGFWFWREVHRKWQSFLQTISLTQNFVD